MRFFLSVAAYVLLRQSSYGFIQPVHHKGHFQRKTHFTKRYVGTKEKTTNEKDVQQKRTFFGLRNGKVQEHMKQPEAVEKMVEISNSTEGNTTSTDIENLAAMAAVDITELIDEINARVSNGTAQLFKNLTEGMDDKLVLLPEKSANELSTYLSDLAKQIQKAQQQELELQLAEIERRFVRPLEDLAFSDVPLLEPRKEISDKKVAELAEQYRSDLSNSRNELVLLGKNSTLRESRRLRTKDILRNWNVAPFYYSIALLTRWVRKASYPSIYLLSLYKDMALVIKSNTKPDRKMKSKDPTFATGETLQAGWKRTGEIAAKGLLAKKWAILRRSAEIWSYFSSFYIKDRHITAKYNSGKWSEEKFKEERSKLGAEVTQNLLKLGPSK